jgi:predicted chitinase
MQVTGRANYRAGGFEDNPNAMAEPQNAADSAARWWENNGLDGRTRDVLDRTQFDAVTHTVNRRELGAQERWEAYQRALAAFGVP